jgi:hypothetical protein
MASTLEVIGYVLLFRPVHAAAIAVFLYQALAGLIRARRETRRPRATAGTPGAGYAARRGFAA